MSNSKFHHEEILRGADLVHKLGNVHVTVCGCGAIGSNLVDTLVRQGFSKIRVIDKDRVDTHNLNTQNFDEVNIGALKASVVQEKAFQATGVEIEAVTKELNQGSIKKLLRGSNLVVDAFDNTASRQLLQEYCRANDIFLLHSGMSGDMYGEVVWDKDYRVPQDGGEDICDYPLARNLILFVVAIASEEIIDFCLQKSPRFGNHSITLKDLAIRKYL